MSKNKDNANSAYLPDGTRSVRLISHETYDEYFLEYDHSRTCTRCGGCNCISKGSAYTQTVRHLPLGSHARLLTFKKKRYYCKDCNASFYEHPAWLHQTLHMTNELFYDICLKLTELIPLKTIASLCCVPESVVRDVMDSINFDMPSYLPETLCIDEFKGDSGTYSSDRKRWHHDRYQCNLVNGASGSCVDILPDYHVDYLRRYFMSFDEASRESVRYVCCDMHNGYVTLARKCFPNAVVCVDMFHVVKDLNKAVDQVRIRLQRDTASSESYPSSKVLFNLSRSLKTKETNQEQYWTTNAKHKQEQLNDVLSTYPELSTAYDALQEFHVINDSSTDIRIHRADLSDWIARYTACGVHEVEVVAGSIKYWRKNVENSWEYGKSNASCEGVNKRIKDIKRISNGMQTFENFRKRILLICGDTHLYHPPYEYAMPKRHKK